LNPDAPKDLDFHTGLVPFKTEQAHSTLGHSSPANVPARSPTAIRPNALNVEDLLGDHNFLLHTISLETFGGCDYDSNERN